MGQDISILQAATLWFSGELPKHVTLWGCPLIFWDPLGQVIEFVGALAVVVDLMAAERLSAIAVDLLS